MSIAGLIRRMAELGAPPEAIAVAVEAIEEANRKDSERRANDARRTAVYRARGGGAISDDLRQAVFARDGFACVYCGSGDHLQCDHVTPVSKGGATTLDNLATACRVCNARKRDRDRKYVQRHSADIARTGQDSPRTKERSPTPPKENTSPSSEGSVCLRAGDVEFEKLWAAYPKRDGSNPKQPARKAFERAVKRGAAPEEVIRAAQREAEAARGRDPRYTPQLVTWLNQDRFRDEPQKPQTRQLNGQQPARTNDIRQAFSFLDDLADAGRERERSSMSAVGGGGAYTVPYRQLPSR